VVDVDQVVPNPFSKKAPGTLTIAFNLKPAGADQGDLAAQLDRARARVDQAKEQFVLNKSKYGEKHPANIASDAELKKSMAELTRLEQQAGGARRRKLIDSQFQMEIGETVVVGTSRIGGDKGLVVLLTAVASGK